MPKSDTLDWPAAFKMNKCKNQKILLRIDHNLTQQKHWLQYQTATLAHKIHKYLHYKDRTTLKQISDNNNSCTDRIFLWVKHSMIHFLCASLTSEMRSMKMLGTEVSNFLVCWSLLKYNVQNSFTELMYTASKISCKYSLKYRTCSNEVHAPKYN
jgi:hypothetical protein